MPDYYYILRHRESGKRVRVTHAPAGRAPSVRNVYRLGHGAGVVWRCADPVLALWVLHHPTPDYNAEQDTPAHVLDPAAYDVVYCHYRDNERKTYRVVRPVLPDPEHFIAYHAQHIAGFARLHERLRHGEPVRLSYQRFKEMTHWKHTRAGKLDALARVLRHA